MSERSVETGWDIDREGVEGHEAGPSFLGEHGERETPARIAGSVEDPAVDPPQ